jgi:hypothetical protein
MGLELAVEKLCDSTCAMSQVLRELKVLRRAVALAMHIRIVQRWLAMHWEAEGTEASQDLQLAAELVELPGIADARNCPECFLLVRKPGRQVPAT